MNAQANPTKKPHPIFQVGETPKEQCDYPAYLFWKLQSQLTKLDYRLNRLSHQNESTHEPMDKH
ncbi:MAG: hypothetical protein U9R28_07490 [Pseudomonadota bacterium]|nr:hypothetical protein [Pseudomonadota bacterium]